MMIDDMNIKKIILNYTPDAMKIRDINDTSRIKDDLLIDSLSYISLIIDIEKEFKINLTTSQELFDDKVDYHTIKKVIQVQTDSLKNKE